MARQTTLSTPTVPYTANPARALAHSPNVRIVLFLALHIPLAFMLDASSWISTGHAALVAVLGLRAALLRRPTQVVAVLGYIASSEVLWRMTDASLLWEHSKYISVAIVGLALLMEWRGRGIRQWFRSLWPVVLMFLLVPASFMTILDMGLIEARDPLSFNLSGHLALGMTALYVWARPLSRRDAETIMLCVMAPVISVVSLAIVSTLSFTLDFVAASNWATSGNYGPNQVSNALGLGALAGSILMMLLPQGRTAKLFILALTLAFIVQGMLTMSRGGIFSYLLALMVFGFHLMRTSRDRWRFLGVLVIAVPLFIWGIFPSLETYTGGTISQRFSDLDTTGRLEAAIGDLTAFRENPILGTGVGLATDYRSVTMEIDLAAHTEYTRLLAEHGLFGLAVILIMVIILLKRYAAASPGLNRATMAALAVWSMSIMAHSAMRTVAISFAFAIALAAWQLEARQEEEVTEQDAAAESQPAGLAQRLR